MTEKLTAAVVIAKQGPLRESLLALLRALPEIDIIHYLDDPHLALACETGLPPALVLVDGDLVDAETYPAVRLARGQWPDAGFIFFGNDVLQQREAESAGAGQVLLKGHPAPHVVRIIRSMLTVGREDKMGSNESRAGQIS